MKLKIKAKIVDKHKIFPVNVVYDTDKGLAEVRRGFRKLVSERFEVNPDDIYEEFNGFRNQRKIYTVFVDNASRKSIPMQRVKTILEDGKKKEEVVTENVEVKECIKIHNDNPIDQKKRNALNYLTQESFWKSLIEKRKLPLSTTIFLLFAGIGIWQFIRLIFSLWGANLP